MEPKKTIDEYLEPCDKCGGKLTSGSFIERTKKETIIYVFAKCTECDWTEDPRETGRPEMLPNQTNKSPESTNPQ